MEAYLEGGYMTIRIASDLSLPLDAVTQTFGILAVRGSGKSNAAAVMAEGMANASLPFVVVDPTGSWWGLRSSGDGKGPGLGIPIFGGRHADVPLERTAGQMIADLIVEHRLSSVIDVSEFSEGDKIRFLTDFAERLYRKNEDPLHLFLEEADDYVPQRPFREQARCLRAWENIVRRGRARGLGITMISQRSAAINKNVLTQIETLIVLRTTSPQDRKAIEGWVTYHGQSRELLESLPGLENGEAWVWSPHWLGKLVRVQIRRRETFDSAATPKNVRGKRPPATLADVDLGAVRKRMAETIEKAKAEDPRELRKQIVALKEELRKAKVAAPSITPEEVERIYRDAVKQNRASLRPAWKRLRDFFSSLQDTTPGLLETVIAEMEDVIPLKHSGQFDKKTRLPERRNPLGKHRAPEPRRVNGNSPPDSDGKISSSQQRILDSLAWLESVGIGRANKVQVALLADHSPTSGGYFNNLGRLRTLGLISYPSPSILALTDSGRAAAKQGDIPTTSEELHDQLFRKLSGSQNAILRILIAAYPDDMAKTDLAEQAGQSPTSGGYFNNLGRLRSLGLIDYPAPGRVVANRVLFLEG